MRPKDTFFCPKTTINCRGKLLDLSTPKVMGVVNLTPDSFYEKSRAQQTDAVIKKVQQMLDEGAHIIDVGAYSSRPGATDISTESESQRLIPVLKELRSSFPEAVFSTDTFRAAVARQAIEAGADIINDISAGELDSDMFTTVAELKVPYILMHMKGTPQNMQDNLEEGSIIREVLAYFIRKVEKLKLLGVNDLILDPGFGFGKTLQQNYELLNKLDHFKIFELPVLAGISRKSMVNKVLKIKPESALNGTTVLNTIALMNGANILRVHDVREAVEVVKLIEAGR